MAEREIEPREVLRRTRIEVAPYLSEIRTHARAILPRLEVSKRWIKYYEDLSKVRALRPRERRALERHRNALTLYEARIELYRKMARYARTKTAPDLTRMRLAQARYYEAKAVLLPPEKAEKLRKELVPPEELYREWRETVESIEAKCLRYKQAKYRLIPITPVERYITMKSLGAALRSAYARAADLSKRGEALPTIVREYAELMGKE